MAQQEDITVENYCDRYVPQPGILLIEKDKAMEKLNSGLFLSKQTRGLMVKYSGIGTIKKVSPFKCESEHDDYLSNLYRVGDVVVFNSSSPIDAPIPPNSKFIDREVALVLLHVADLMGHYTNSKDNAESIEERT